jgi:hypothetical protein
VRKLVIDFELTVLWPLLVFALIVLLNSVLAWRSPGSNKYFWERSSEERQQEQEERRWRAKGLGWLSAVLVLLVGAVLVAGDTVKLHVAGLAWPALQFISAITFIITIPVAWNYARTSDRLRLAICLLVLLLTAASTEHFFHQTINAQHAICPHCTDDDERPDE